MTDSEERADVGEVDDAVTLALMKIGRSIARGIYFILGVAVIGSFGAGVFFATLDAKMTAIALDTKTVATRLRNVELTVAREILPEAERAIVDLRQRVSELERLGYKR